MFSIFIVFTCEKQVPFRPLEICNSCTSVFPVTRAWEQQKCNKIKTKGRKAREKSEYGREYSGHNKRLEGIIAAHAYHPDGVPLTKWQIVTYCNNCNVL